VSQIPLDLIEPQAVAVTFNEMKAKHFFLNIGTFQPTHTASHPELYL